jgi:hypothetical protein
VASNPGREAKSFRERLNELDDSLVELHRLVAPSRSVTVTASTDRVTAQRIVDVPLVLQRWSSVVKGTQILDSMLPRLRRLHRLQSQETFKEPAERAKQRLDALSEALTLAETEFATRCQRTLEQITAFESRLQACVDAAEA